jgi:LuxR family maltose regulon positive regulatory protein
VTGELLTTRLVLPRPAPDLVPRPALAARLTAAAQGPLTLIAAPAGAGKTSLASSWARDGLAPGPVAWVSLDGERLTRRLFWTLVLTSVEAALPGERPFRMPGQVDGALVSFMNRMAERTEPVVLVLDDFHGLADPDVIDDLNVLLEHPSRSLRIVLLSRRDPPLRLVRLRIAGSLAELRAQDLAFTEEEGLALLREAAVPGLTPEDAAALLRRTEGWAAGLRMAVLTLRGHPDPAAFVRAFAGGDAAVTDYLLTEVLDHLSEDDRRFLLRAALTDAVCGELADAITGGKDGARRLQRLAGENAMLEPLDGRAEWFRFHPLLRDLLRAELRADAAADLPRLHRTAATWLIAAGWVREATRHALASGDRALVAEVVAHGWIELYLDGGVATLRSLVDMLPADVVAEEPELALAAAVVQIEDGDVERADVALSHATAGRSRLPPERHAQFTVAFVVVLLRRARLHGDLDAALSEARRRLGRHVPAVPAPGLQALALASIGIAELWAGDRERAVVHLEMALGEASLSDHDYVAALALSHLALSDALDGRLRRAFERCRTAVAIVERHGALRSSAAAAAFGTLAGVQYLWDDFDSASRSLEHAVEALEAAPERPLRALIAANRTRVLSALGDAEGALAALRFEQLRLEDFAHPQLTGILDAQHGLLLDALGEAEEARELLERDEATPEVAVALARLRLSDGAAGEALALAQSVIAAPPDRTLASSRVQAHAVAALAHDAQLDHPAAAAELRRALDLAEPRGLRRVLTELGPALRPVLRRELRAETAHRSFVEELVEALDGAKTGRVPASHPYEPLSERETTVLRFLPTMMSNQEIASELFVSVNTLKTHLKQIYRKLDVASRRDAVERARGMGLLAPGPGLRNRS